MLPGIFLNAKKDIISPAVPFIQYPVTDQRKIFAGHMQGDAEKWAHQNMVRMAKCHPGKQPGKIKDRIRQSPVVLPPEIFGGRCQASDGMDCRAAQRFLIGSTQVPNRSYTVSITSHFVKIHPSSEAIDSSLSERVILLPWPWGKITAIQAAAQ